MRAPKTGSLTSVAILLALAALAGLHGLGSVHLNPATSATWGGIALGAAVLEARRTGGHLFTTMVALAVALIALFASLLVLFPLLPCGPSCR